MRQSSTGVVLRKLARVDGAINCSGDIDNVSYARVNLYMRSSGHIEWGAYRISGHGYYELTGVAPAPPPPTSTTSPTPHPPPNTRYRAQIWWVGGVVVGGCVGEGGRGPICRLEMGIGGDPCCFAYGFGLFERVGGGLKEVWRISTPRRKDFYYDKRISRRSQRRADTAREKDRHTRRTPASTKPSGDIDILRRIPFWAATSTLRY